MFKKDASILLSEKEYNLELSSEISLLIASFVPAGLLLVFYCSTVSACFVWAGWGREKGGTYMEYSLIICLVLPH